MSFRLATSLGALTQATDASAGLPPESALRTAVLAVSLARALGRSGDELRETFDTAVLRFLGCSAWAHEATAFAGGDDRGFLGALTPGDATRPLGLIALHWRGVAPTAPLARRLGAIARLAATPSVPRELARSHCELAMRLATRLGFGDGVVASLGQAYERWDGRGQPLGLAGEAIRPAARVLHLAWRYAAVFRALGEADANAMVAARRGAEYAPDVVDALPEALRTAREALSAPTAVDAFLDAESLPHRQVASLDDALDAFGRHADLKSPFTLGHSAAVAELAARAADALGLDPAARQRLRQAGLVHDLGRTAIANGVWDKPGPLTDAEWVLVRDHASATARILEASPATAALAALASGDHERPDGSGYPRGQRDADAEAHVLSAADAWVAMSEPRAWRGPRTPEEATAVLRDEARAGRRHASAVDAVLAAVGVAGHVAGGVDGLSEREVEVLRHVARGLTNAQIGVVLGLSPATVKNHVANVYAKTGIDSRATAAIYAVDRGLFRR